jgi:hypothetical protein
VAWLGHANLPQIKTKEQVIEYGSQNQQQQELSEKARQNL